MSMILPNYYVITKFANVPESRTEDKKTIPDYTTQAFIDEKSGGPRFDSRIYWELKSVKGDYMPMAIKQLATAVFLRFGNSLVNEGYLVVVRGSNFAFLEYFAYLDTEEKKCYLRTIPFNRKLSGETEQKNRPTYQGLSRYKFPDTQKDTYVLDAVDDKETVHNVLVWMRDNKPRDISRLIDSAGYFTGKPIRGLNSLPGSRVSSFISSGQAPVFPFKSPAAAVGDSNLALFPGPSSPKYSPGDITVKKRNQKGASTQSLEQEEGEDYLGTATYAGNNNIKVYTSSNSRSFSIMEVDE